MQSLYVKLNYLVGCADTCTGAQCDYSWHKNTITLLLAHEHFLSHVVIVGGYDQVSVNQIILNTISTSSSSSSLPL